ncbi:hypothetical protein [Ferruginibacter sp.]|nr:DinB family protein [Ferruginibacter sp.]
MIFYQLTEQLQLLSNLLSKLTAQQYNNKIFCLGNASIGGHTRHIIELLKCVLDGYETGVVDYINRIRNSSLETDLNLAAFQINEMVTQIIQPDKKIKVITEDGATNFVTSSFYREIVYNAEHAIHHLALIKVALREMNLNITGNDFGMAPSTIKYLALVK